MKHVFKYGMAIFAYAILILVFDFIIGIGMKDQWDKLMKWSKK